MSTANTKDGENLSDWREAVFTFKPDLSYQPSMPLAGVRYFRVFTVHVKPGHGDHFESVRKIVKAAHEKAKLDEHFAVFSLVAGGAPNTYVIFIPMKSLKEIDDYAALHGQTYKDALGADGQKQIDDFQREAVESSETNILAFSPEISYPSEKWIAADKFWAPAAPAKPAAKKKE